MTWVKCNICGYTETVTCVDASTPALKWKCPRCGGKKISDSVIKFIAEVANRYNVQYDLKIQTIGVTERPEYGDKITHLAYVITVYMDMVSDDEVSTE